MNAIEHAEQLAGRCAEAVNGYASNAVTAEIIQKELPLADLLDVADKATSFCLVTTVGSKNPGDAEKLALLAALNKLRATGIKPYYGNAPH